MDTYNPYTGEYAGRIHRNGFGCRKKYFKNFHNQDQVVDEKAPKPYAQTPTVSCVESLCCGQPPKMQCETIATSQVNFKVLLTASAASTTLSLSWTRCPS